jgi:hypothetical protein
MSMSLSTPYAVFCDYSQDRILLKDILSQVVWQERVRHTGAFSSCHIGRGRAEETSS